MNITNLIQQAHANAESKGWHEDREQIESKMREGEYFLIPGTFGEQVELSEESEQNIDTFRNYYRTAKLMLMVCELSEAVEAIRKGDEENHAEELADVMIRMFDYCGEFQIALEGAIKAKMAINEHRPYKHNKLL